MSNIKQEIHLFIIWTNALDYRAQIIEDIEKGLIVLGIHDIDWSADKFEENITRFYRKRPNMADKANRIGRGYFTLLVVKDENPNYQVRDTSKGQETVNVNIFDRKEKFRKLTGPPNDLIHATNNETIVFSVIPSPSKYHVKNVKEIIPEPNAINLPGQSNPS